MDFVFLYLYLPLNHLLRCAYHHIMLGYALQWTRWATQKVYSNAVVDWNCCGSLQTKCDILLVAVP